jgi:uncharacterized sulfatase
MNRFTTTLLTLAGLVVAVCPSVAAGAGASGTGPNVVWILSEDNSKHFLKLFDESGATTPHIEKLAADGLAFDHAFSCAPVCSVARTTLMSGIYAPRIGTRFHRKMKPVTLPESWHLWPWYLRQAGYYTSNNSKTDYNTAGNEGVWDDSSNRASWRNRPQARQPFFHMQTYGQSHESSLHFSREDMEADPTETDPASVTLADYHPDSTTFRYTYARYHDRMKVIDGKVDELVKQLEDDGLLEETFIFYFGDHGGVLPGSKGYARDTGLHVPLVVRVPEKWKHLVDADRGSRVTGFVSFVDFGATVLHLAGVKIPKHIDGRPFLGRGISMRSVNRRDTVFGYADRFDEKYELIRAVRRGRFKYVRNFQPYYSDGLQNNYRYRMLAFEEWRTLFQQGALKEAQSQFFRRKPAEALYDMEADPYETVNLADDPDYRRQRNRLRKVLWNELRDWGDLSFYPEDHLVANAVDAPMEFSRTHRRETLNLIRAAEWQVRDFKEAKPRLEQLLQSDDRWERYWGTMNCAAFGAEAAELGDAVKPLLDDTEPTVRIRAAEFLGGIGAVDPRPTLMDVLEKTGSPETALIALNAVVYLRDMAPHWRFSIAQDDLKVEHGEIKNLLDYLNR